MQQMSIACIYVIQKKLVRIIHHEGRLAHNNCLFMQMHSLKFHDLVKGALYRIWCGVNRFGDSGVKVV